MAFSGSGGRRPRRPVPINQPPSYVNGSSGEDHAGYPATDEYLAGGENLAPADPWDRPAGWEPPAGWDPPAAGRGQVTGPWHRPPGSWEPPAGPPSAQWDQPPRSRNRSNRRLPWVVAVVIIALAGSIVAFRLVTT
jgi:hypothetical protein